MNGYLYETHMHTSEGSACGQAGGAQMARAYGAGGYAGIIVTDHFFYGNTAVDRSLPWRDWVERFCLGYEHARAEGEKLGLQVFFGWESCYQGTEFLVYGLDKEWLLSHPQIRDATVEEQYAMVHEGGGFISHAHPFREASYIPGIRLFPEYVDAVEGINATHTSPFNSFKGGHKEFNDRALAYGREHSLPLTAGSDQHSTAMIRGGMLFPRRLEDIHDFTRAVAAGEALRLVDSSDEAFWNGKQAQESGIFRGV